MADPRYELLYVEAQRQLEAQHRELHELRARASWLVSATAVSTSFLGGGLIREGAPGDLGWVAIVLFATTIALALWALAGSVTEMPDGFSPKTVGEEWIRRRGLGEDALRLNLALYLERAVEAHDGQLALRRKALTLGAITLALEIAVWMIDLR